jgi:hypothetical protein
MQGPHHSLGPEQLREFRASNCTCSFCLFVFSMRDPSEKDLVTFQLHLQRVHGLTPGEIEA